MTPPWVYLDAHDRATFQMIVVFLDKRLEEPATINWSLQLKPSQRVERLAISHILNGPKARVLREPWLTAWRLIEESWSSGVVENGGGSAIYSIKERLQAGDRSGAILSVIIALVAPCLKVGTIDSWRWQVVKKPRHAKTFDHLLSASLTSGDLVDLSVLKLGELSDLSFLIALANALESAVVHGLDMARRIGWDGKKQLWKLGFLHRIYYIQPARRAGDETEPDAYNQGIAPSAKLLHAVVSRIAELDVHSAALFMQRWQFIDSPVHVRLWAAMARSSQLIASEKVGTFLLGLDTNKFWNLHEFPEIAELRAVRFGDLSQETQKAIVTRLRRGPPRDHWPKKADPEKVKTARLYWAVRELKRIDVAGGNLKPDARHWLEAKIDHFAELVTMTIDEGFPEGPTARSVPPNPDDKYNTLQGTPRLQALEAGLSTGRRNWDDDPSERANDWLQQVNKAILVLGDLEAAQQGGNAFPLVWDRFGWAHSPRPSEPEEANQRDLQSEADRVLALLIQLSAQALSSAIEGISNWLDAWSKQVVASSSGLPVWLRVWPIAVEATNARPEKVDDANLSVTARSANDDREPMDLDTLNTPSGKLVGVFLSACPSLAQEPIPFATGSTARQMRDVVIVATGRSGLIARHRMIEALSYFLRADRDWSQEHLIAPLLNDDGASIALWRAIARRTHFTETLEIIGRAMAERAADRRLGRETRRKLVFSLVVESLHALRENRDPAVPNSLIQQMLRTIDDEVRASAANAIQQFVHDLSTHQPADENTLSAEELFRSTASPFLREVWPQERSLATPGVSGALSDLPAVSGEAFAEAVDAIERFLVPFECWSMVNYGLYGEDGETKKLAIINNEVKATALLRMLDLTIGSSEGAVVPYDLTDALDQIQTVSPALVSSQAFRRLSTMARR